MLVGEQTNKSMKQHREPEKDSYPTHMSQICQLIFDKGSNTTQWANSLFMKWSVLSRLALLGHSCWNEPCYEMNHHPAPCYIPVKVLFFQTSASRLLFGSHPGSLRWSELIIPAGPVTPLLAFWYFGKRILKWSDGGQSNQLNGTWQKLAAPSNQNF